MTQISTARPSTGAKDLPSRRVLVGLAVVILVLFVAMVGTSHDISYNTPTAKITDAYDISKGASQIGAYAGMVFVAMLLFFGGALRNALRSAGKSWLADPALLTTKALPKWLAIASIVIGVIAPLGPLGFVGFLLLPLWIVAVAVCVRLDV